MKFKTCVDSGGITFCDLGYVQPRVAGDSVNGHVIDVPSEQTLILGSVKWWDVAKALHYTIPTPTKKLYIGDIGCEVLTDEVWKEFCKGPGEAGVEVRMGGDGLYHVDLEVSDGTK